MIHLDAPLPYAIVRLRSHPDKAARFMKGQIAKQKGIHDAEDGGAGADTETHDDDREEGERCIATKRAQIVSDILHCRFDELQAANSAVSFTKLGGCSELQQSFPPRRFRCDTEAHLFFFQHGQMHCYLGLEITVLRTCPEDCTDTRYELMNMGPHPVYPFAAESSRRPITPEIRSQFSVSDLSCLRPAFVIE
jgi:hypothetical protein